MATDSRITRIPARSGESTIGIVRSDKDPAEIGVVVHEQFPDLGIDHLTTVIVNAADLRAALDEHIPAAEPTDAECIEVLTSVTTPFGEKPGKVEWAPAAIQRCREAMVRARAARRNEEKN